MQHSDVLNTDGLVDWDLAVRVANWFADSRPDLTEAEERAVAEDLHRIMAEADEHVRAVTGLDPASPAPPVVVVTRPE